MRYKAAHIVSSIDNPSAGTTYSVVRLTESVNESGFRTVLISLKGRQAGLSTVQAIGPAHVQWPYSMALGKFGERAGLSRSIFTFNPVNFDILHLHGLWMLPNILPGLYAKKSGVPYVVSPHGMLGGAALSFSPIKKKLALMLGQQNVLTNASCLRATADSEADELRDFGLVNPIAVIPNGIDIPPTFEPFNSNEPPYILSLGRIHPKKGLLDLILAWSKVQHLYPGHILKIIGPCEGGYSQVLKDTIARRRIANVTIEGAIFGSQKWNVMSQARFFVLPTLNENFANTVAESLSVGTPVISTKGAPWSGLRQKRCGWWVDIGQDGLVEALTQASFVSDAERYAMGQRGRAWVDSDFSWESVARCTVELYEWILFGGDRPRFVYFG